MFNVLAILWMHVPHIHVYKVYCSIFFQIFDPITVYTCTFFDVHSTRVPGYMSCIHYCGKLGNIVGNMCWATSTFHQYLFALSPLVRFV